MSRATRRRGLLCGLAATCTLGFFAGPAGAHGELDQADPPPGERLPASPRQIEVTLTEPVAPVSRLSLVDEDNRKVEIAKTEVDGPVLRAKVETLDTGTYTVRWAAVSEVDGHLSSGQFRFSVRDRAPAEIAEGAGTGNLVKRAWPRLLIVGGALLWAGALLLATFVVGPSAGESAVLPGFARKLHAAAAAAILALLSGELMLMVAASSGGLSVFTTGFFFGSTAGALTLARIGVGVAGLALWLALSRRRWDRYGLPLPLLYLGLLALSGHAVDAPAGPVSGAMLDLVHLVAAAAWLGGITLLGLLPSGARGTPDASAVAATAGRFSPIALTSVAALAVTGVFATDQQTRSLSDLPATLYGNVLTIKLVLVAVLVAMSVRVGLRLRPALLASPPSGERAVRLASKLRGSLRAEVPVAAAIIVCVALMTSVASPGVLATEVASDEGSSPPVGPVFGRTESDEGHNIALSVFPGARGANTVAVSVTGRERPPDEIELLLDAPGEGKGVGFRLRGRDGVYVADVDLPAAGSWLATVDAGETDADFDLPVGVPTRGATGTRAVTIADLTGPAHVRCRDEVIGQLVALKEADPPVTPAIVDARTGRVGRSPSVLLGGCGVEPDRLERLAAELEIPLVAAGGADGGRWSWPLDPDPRTEGEVLGRLGAEALRARTAVIAFEDARRYRLAAAAFRRRFRDEGGTIEASRELGDRRTPEEIASLAADLLVVLGSPEAATPVVSALDRRRWLPRRGVLASSSLMGQELGRAAPGWADRGAVSVAGYYLQQVGMFAPYAEGVLETFPGERPTVRGFHGYLKARLLVEALRGLEARPGPQEIARALDSRFREGWPDASIDVAWRPDGRSGARRLALYRLTPAVDWMQLLGEAHEHGASGGGLSLYSAFYGTSGPPIQAGG